MSESEKPLPKRMSAHESTVGLASVTNVIRWQNAIPTNIT